MDVRIVEFPETPVAVAEHRGPPALEYQTSQRLIRWRIANGLSPHKHRTYGVHYTDPQAVVPEDHRVDFCVSHHGVVAPNAEGIVGKLIPACRCAVARHLGSRRHNTAAVHLYREWLPRSGERPGDFPIFFHYVNVGPDVKEEDMVTDVYLPLSPAE
ncbi:MAG TPA: GyrI-like domain-containing protein [Solimonas sp.]